MKWINIKDELPTVNGKYVVETISPLGSIRRLETTATINQRKVSWSCTNQEVIKWLKENE